MKRFAADTRGNLGMMAGVSMLVVVGLAGASIDYSVASSAKARSQQIADAVALQAAVFVRNNSRAPTANDADGIVEGRHTAAALGYDFGLGVSGGAANVAVDVDYDQTNGLVNVTVSGLTETSFSRVMGKDSLDFTAKTVVNFEKEDTAKKASVLLVLDNSGSMAWDDKKASLVTTSGGSYWDPNDEAIPRVDSLKSNVKNFMAFLDQIVGQQATSEEKVLRTGMMAYNTGIISSRTRTMQWSLLPDSHVDAMTADGGTNSSIPIDEATRWIEAEPAAHALVHDKKPLKFVILMTDGVNNNKTASWRAQSGTGQWRTTYDAKYSTGSTWYQQSAYWYEKGTTMPDTTWSQKYYSKDRGWYTIDYRADDNDWEEGEWSKPDDEATLADCAAMKAKGVKIYTIGFALEPGVYGRNSYDSYGREYVREIKKEETDAAYAMLSACASDEDSFKVAANAEELNQSFADIGQDILEEFIRIKS